MDEALRRLYAGEFNDMFQFQRPDGSVEITLRDRKDGKTYRLVVEDLYGPAERVVESELVDQGPPAYLTDRLEQAKGRADHG